ncbi:PAS domain S-box protein [Arenibaculum sp.]|uniref:PAS domain S-box protein n=1 Tax=Arenibaculum sp. TaxID=2865862 RepID=UPI002E1148EF|nr:PAS domain S-box protein [Arenibaculum sp.]
MFPRIPLLVLIGTALLPVIVFGGIMVALLDARQRETVDIQVRQSARAVIQAIDRQLLDYVASLRTLAASPDLDAGDLATFREHARRVLADEPNWISIQLTDGRTRRPLLDLDARGGAAGPGTIDDPGALDAVLSSGQPVIGGVERTEGGDAFAVALKVPVRQDGAVRYVLTLAVRAEGISRELAELPAPRDWTLAVLDREYRIVGRSRAPDEYVGTRATGTLTDEIVRASENSFFSLNKEGERVHTAFSRSPVSGWTAAVGAPAELVETPVRRVLLVSIAGGLVAALLAVGLVAVLLRNVLARQSAERRLEAERRLSDIAENFPGVIFRRVRYPDGRMAYRYVGGRVEPLIGDSVLPMQVPAAMEEFAKLIHPDDVQRWRETLTRSAERLEPYQIEGRVVHSDGRTRWARAAANVHREPDGTVVWDGVVVDVTDLKTAEAAQRASEARTRVIVEAVADGIVTFDERGIVESINPAAARLFGHPPQAVVGKAVSMLVPDARGIEFGQGGGPGLEAAARDGTAELAGLRADGSRFPMELSLGEAAIDGRRIFAAVIRDVSERRQAEAERAHLAAIVESSSDAIFGTDLENRITNWNAAATRIYGYEPSDVIGHPVSRFMSADQAAERQALADRVARGEQVIQYETVRVRKDGRPVEVSMTLSPIRQPNGGIVGISTIARDITERKAVERTLRRTLAEKDDLLRQKVALLHEVHHRVKNNLQVISAMVSLEARQIENEAARTRMNMIGQRVYAMGQVHEQLYASGDVARINLADYVEELARGLSRMYSGLPVGLEVEAEGRGWFCDLETAIPLGLILNELITNAFKHAFPADRDGRVRVRLRRLGDDGAVRLTVEDDGIGTGEDGDAGAKGIGMTLIRVLARQIDAEIRFEAGEGTSVVVDLPASACAVAA